MKLQIFAAVVLAVVIGGCAASNKSTSPDVLTSGSANAKRAPASADTEPSTDNDFELLEEDLSGQMIEIADPLEPLNRTMYNLKPLAQTVEHLIPKPARIGIRNFFGNLTTPVRFVNCHLQGKTDAADTELNRFIINTTAGVLGFGDPALDQHGLEPVDEDLGQSLAGFGLGNWFYIVWPFFGPSTFRDSLGMVGDWFLNPVYYVEPTEASVTISATRYANESSFHIGEYEAFKSAAVDPYVATRNAYIQHRNKAIQE
jgi:phospholipid-binding lipoprotein MlaA